MLRRELCGGSTVGGNFKAHYLEFGDRANLAGCFAVEYIFKILIIQIEILLLRQITNGIVSVVDVFQREKKILIPVDFENINFIRD